MMPTTQTQRKTVKLVRSDTLNQKDVTMDKLQTQTEEQFRQEMQAYSDLVANIQEAASIEDLTAESGKLALSSGILPDGKEVKVLCHFVMNHALEEAYAKPLCIIDLEDVPFLEMPQVLSSPKDLYHNTVNAGMGARE